MKASWVMRPWSMHFKVRLTGSWMRSRMPSTPECKRPQRLRHPTVLVSRSEFGTVRERLSTLHASSFAKTEVACKPTRRTQARSRMQAGRAARFAPRVLRVPTLSAGRQPSANCVNQVHCDVHGRYVAWKAHRMTSDAGFFQPQEGQFGCISCDSLGDFYGELQGQTVCQHCAANTQRYLGVLSAANKSSCQCKEGGCRSGGLCSVDFVRLLFLKSRYAGYFNRNDRPGEVCSP
jgi:hypothetical protein